MLRLDKLTRDIFLNRA